MVMAAVVGGLAAGGASALMGGLMGGGGGSSTSDSTTTKKSWLVDNTDFEQKAQYYLDNGVPIYWQNQQIAGLTPAEQEALDFLTSGQGINTGKQVAGWGANAIGQSIALEKALLSGDTKINKENFINGVQGIMGGAQSYIDQSTKAATDKILVGYGENAAQFAESNLSGAYTSGAVNGQTAMAVGAGESIESTIAQMNAQALRGAIGLEANGMSAVGRAYGNAINMGLGLGEGAIGTGMQMIGKGTSNMMEGGLFEQYMNQQQMNNDWRNSMYTHNIPTIADLMGFNIAAGTANIDTTTHTHTKSSSSGGGLF